METQDVKLTPVVRRVLLTQVRASRWQPRGKVFDAERLWELACSIREQGLINAIVVFQWNQPDDKAGLVFYELVAGERRTRAVMGLAWAKVAGASEKECVEALARGGLEAVPAEVRELLDAGRVEVLARVEPSTDLDRLRQMAVVENIERESLNPVEEARALQGLMESMGWSQRTLGQHIGKSQGYVAQRLGLLGLTEAAQEAVNTRVLTATHARAIAAVPKALQGVVTEWATSAVGREDTPATTRQVQNMAREVAAFVDPARWEPQSEHVYQPEERNNLRLIQWAVQRADLERCGKELLTLREWSYNKTNVLGKKPITVVESRAMVEAVLARLGAGETTTKLTWEAFAVETGRTCETCVVGRYPKPTVVAEDLPVYCGRWRGRKQTTCEDFIGEGDPVVVPVEYHLLNLFEELGITCEKADRFHYVTDVAGYIVSYGRAVKLEEEQAAREKEKRASRHVVDIRAFQEWMLEQPDQVLRHFQAHSCTKCGNDRPELEEQGLPGCRFVVEPLKGRQYGPGGGDHRAPEFGALATREGQLLPRCEMFVYQEVPAISNGGGEKFGDRKRAATWMVGLGRSGGYGSDRGAMWGILRWLDYGRPVEEKNDWERLERFVVREWEELGGDGAVATLLDVVLSERLARDQQRSREWRLVNATTGEEEEFVPVSWQNIGGRESWPDYVRREWPEGWKRPWKKGDEQG